MSGTEAEEREIFASAEKLSPEPEAPAVTQEAPAGDPVAEAPEEEPSDLVSGDPEGQEAGQAKKEPQRVPYGALKEERERLRQHREESQQRERQWAEERTQMLRMLAELRQQPQTPQAPVQEKSQEDILAELLTNPQEFLNNQLARERESILDQQFEDRAYYSERAAVKDHGKEAVDAAKAALQDAVQRGELDGNAIKQQLRQSRDPMDDIIKWHKQHTTISQIGTDPDAYRERLRAEILAEMNGTPAAQPGQAPATPTPSLPSLTRASGNAGITAQATVTEQDIFDAAPAFGKKRA
jgi:hypothetical protein